MIINIHFLLTFLVFGLAYNSVAMEEQKKTENSELKALIKATIHEELDITARENDGSEYTTSLKEYVPKLSHAFHTRIIDLANRMGILEQSFMLQSTAIEALGRRTTSIEGQLAGIQDEVKRINTRHTEIAALEKQMAALQVKLGQKAIES